MCPNAVRALLIQTFISLRFKVIMMILYYVDVEGGVRSLLLTMAAECLSVRHLNSPRVPVCRDHKRACLYRYGEGPPGNSRQDGREEKGDFLPLWNFHVFSFKD